MLSINTEPSILDP